MYSQDITDRLDSFYLAAARSRRNAISFLKRGDILWFKTALNNAKANEGLARRLEAQYKTC